MTYNLRPLFGVKESFFGPAAYREAEYQQSIAPQSVQSLSIGTSKEEPTIEGYEKTIYPQTGTKQDLMGAAAVSQAQAFQNWASDTEKSEHGNGKPITVVATEGSVEVYDILTSVYQTNVTIDGYKISGTLNYLDEGTPVEWYHLNHFLVLDFDDSEIPEGATNVVIKVGLNPTAGTGLVPLDVDMRCLFAITNTKQKVVVETTYTLEEETVTKNQSFELSGITLAPAENN